MIVSHFAEQSDEAKVESRPAGFFYGYNSFVKQGGTACTRTPLQVSDMNRRLAWAFFLWLALSMVDSQTGEPVVEERFEPFPQHPCFYVSHGEEVCMSDKEISRSLGREFGRGLRGTSGYEATRARMEQEGITDELLNRTPPVGLNLQLLSEMPGIAKLAHRIGRTPVSVAMLGLASIDGVEDTQRFIAHALGTELASLHVVDIDEEIIGKVSALKKEKSLTAVLPHLIDARHTGIADHSIDLVLRDHTGNCCPPEIDRAIDGETARILKPGGTSIVNITTSELLPLSEHRESVNLSNGARNHPTLTDALRKNIYDLRQLTAEFGEDLTSMRGKLIEIERPGGFVVFGEDPNGHGEWFRTLGNHMSLWQRLGFFVSDIKSRFGNDSHTPPLLCMRHNIVLTKKGGDA